jgi:hypothetical protein
LAVERRQRERRDAEEPDDDRDGEPPRSRLRSAPVRAKPRNVT